MEERPRFSLQVPEEEVSYPLIGQRFLDEEASQRIVQVHFILQHLGTVCPLSFHCSFAVAVMGLWVVYLDQLQQVLGQLVVRQTLDQAAQSEFPHHRVRKVAVQQLQSQLRFHQGPLLQEAVHLQEDGTGLQRSEVIPEKSGLSQRTVDQQLLSNTVYSVSHSPDLSSAAVFVLLLWCVCQVIIREEVKAPLV